ncbi:hydrolase, NUDIX family protein [Trichomonas vaginalis G3]|uniref:Cleavage and polyadenylation specificity factor subunit 5 n=1 Tax=Trichomonas vaginalis (strain ATCC PRA-98 / G3) TaxID=412133 RepID=A2DA19_TRIV3|nr:regulation of mRNA cleavage [Trichomonas vaginalis G3]EAY22667.1 hydrolase, NUDIX family protein [Trichomonas vaginalis G3]KAI5525481.1 regulation of mRNA cleavage [Trichomonas vaginalis G3]|eukprot:XP_001583653.1 hydrolase, NUDIX family protein [Trichomonas vaginalis G3]
MSLRIHKLSNYRFGASEDEEEEEKAHTDRMEKIKEIFAVEGTVKSVRCIILAHEHNITTILLLKNKNKKKLQMPGGIVRTGEEDEAAIKRILTKKFRIVEGEFDIGDHVATWYRPQFSEYLYPYLPAHITQAKEIEKWYIVMLPEKAHFNIQSKNELSALQFIQIHNNVEYQEKTLLYIPAIMSKYDFTFE